MTTPPSPPTDEARIRRNKLVGRIAIIALGLLVVAQVAPMIIRVASGGHV